MSNANRGMYAEELVNRTNSYYYEHDIALIEKRYIPIKIIKTLNENTIIGKLLAKSYVDYCGIYKGKHIEFEVKQTNNNNFDLSLIKQHQLKHLINNKRHGGVAFIIVYFNSLEQFYLISIDNILEWKENNKSNTIKHEFIKDKCQLIEISFPGIIDYLPFIGL